MTNPVTYLQRLRILEMRENGRAVLNRKTYVHRTSGQRVSIQPWPPIARPAFWRETCTDLHKKFDRIIFQDGREPMTRPPNSAQAALRSLFPCFGYAEYVSTIDRPAYIGNPKKNAKETQIAYYSTSQNLSPPVDPRARKAVELLQTLDPAQRVIIPWDMVHMPYFCWKLTELGYVEERSDPTDVAQNSEVVSVICAFVFAFILFPLYLLFKT
mmetsp:Transcript_17713/g.27742  ORF Transcript_17713/g.27742 Transcript_17713/m.27742 type:complete len:213 (-) Transcript_17713:19-657(-)